MKRRWPWAAGALAIAVAVAAVVALAGSDGDAQEPDQAAPNVVQAGAPGEPSRRLSKDALDDVEAPKHGRADVAFMQRMLHHHAQALTMTGYVPKRATGRDVRLLAKRLELSQRNEMDAMRQWLRARDEREAPVQGHEHLPGMVSEAELGRLEAAQGRAFNRRFLRAMIRHHEGALAMVAELRRSGGGLEPEIDRFARHVEADQGIEIARMRQLLADGA